MSSNCNRSTNSRSLRDDNKRGIGKSKSKGKSKGNRDGKRDNGN